MADSSKTLSVFIDFKNGAQMDDAVTKANRAGVAISSHKTLTMLPLRKSSEWRPLLRGFSAWSGTMVGYDIPDKKLGETIEYVEPEFGFRYVFPVPEEYRKKKNVMLVAEHPEFTIQNDGNNRVIVAKKVGGVERFPIVAKAFYRRDDKFNLPTGNIIEQSPEAIFLTRTEKSVGLVGVTADVTPSGLIIFSLLDNVPSFRRGVIAELPASEQDDAPLTFTLELGKKPQK